MENRDKKLRAKKRVQALKSFYSHATVYLVINTFIVGMTAFMRMKEGESLADSFFSFETFVTPFFWGIGLAFHAAKVFSWNPVFTKEWEKRQIEKFMEEDKREIGKY
ncbi:MAG: hypothetical protein CML05_15060 [Pseudozobellia sp.]|nr:hypothetical protein [Pseudozobellia sp.]|tara:strand:+ start:560 stop:880 length:321 start_codon:yes stop_codon:yes gene_type:complete